MNPDGGKNPRIELTSSSMILTDAAGNRLASFDLPMTAGAYMVNVLEMKKDVVDEMIWEAGRVTDRLSTEEDDVPSTRSTETATLTSHATRHIIAGTES